MTNKVSRIRATSATGYVIAAILAALSGAIVALAPILLALPILVFAGATLLYVANRYSHDLNGDSSESWPSHALTALWVLVINLPSIVAFDQTGFTKDQGLFNPQSIGRILIFIAISITAIFFWDRWCRSTLRLVNKVPPAGAKLIYLFYGWYLFSAPLVVSGTALALSVFRSLEWIVAISLLLLLFSVQNAQGKNGFTERLKLVLPILFFLLFSNLIALPIVPHMIYSMSVVTGTGRLGGLFTHPNLLALDCVLLCTYALAFMTGWKRSILVLISVAVLVLTYSRGGFAAFGAMTIFSLWFLIRSIPTRFAILGLSLGTVTVLMQVPIVEESVLGFLARGNTTQTLGTLSERTSVWEASKILIERSPWLGSGFISGPKLLADVMIENRISRNFAAPHAHNELLQALISGGPLALVLSLFLQIKIALLLFRGEGLQVKEKFFSWTLFSGCVSWGLLQPSLSYFLYLPGVLLIWLLLTLEGLRQPRISGELNDKNRIIHMRSATKDNTKINRGLAALLVTTATLLPWNAFASDAFSNSSFVTVTNGHLERDNQRLRVWGINIQSGVFKTYIEIDSLISRIDTLGFNAIRLWPTSGTFYRINANSPPSFSASALGDGSDLDRFDYLVATASRKGINLQMPILHYMDMPTLKTLQEPAIAEMVKASKDESMLRRVHGFAPYVSPGYRDRMKLHMRRVLTRKNPYTGRRYADEPAISTWELANEAIFVHCAITPACLKGLPSIAIAYLDSAWRLSPHNLNKTALPDQFESLIEPSFFVGYSRFVADQFISVSNEMRDFARKIGGPGSGIELQPFIFNTDPGERIAVSHYAYAAGDVFSASAYSSPIASAKGYMGSPWLPFVAGGKPIPFLEYIKVKDKPFIVYEGSFFRPYPFRSEWGIAMAAIAIKQDWDGAFLYSYGQPDVIYETKGKDITYGNKALPDPVPSDKGERGHYAYSFHHGGDPITMASWSVGGRLFLATPDKKLDSEVVWDIPLDKVFAPGTGYPAAFLTHSNLVALPRVKSMAIRFTADTPSCSPCIATHTTTNETITDWNIKTNRLTVKTPGGKAIAGDISGNLGFLYSDISAKTVKPGFGVVAATNDTTGLVKHLYVIGNAENSGSLFEPTRVDFRSPDGAMAGMVARGTTPLIFSGPDVSFLLADPNQKFIEVEFGLGSATKEQSASQYIFSSSSRVFMVDVINTKR